MSKRPLTADQSNITKKLKPSIQEQLEDAVQRFHFFTREADKAAKDIIQYSALLNSNSAESKLLAALSTPLDTNGLEILANDAMDLNVSKSTPSMDVLGLNFSSTMPLTSPALDKSIGLARNPASSLKSKASSEQSITKQQKPSIPMPIRLGTTEKITTRIPPTLPSSVIDPIPKSVKASSQKSEATKQPKPQTQMESTKPRLYDVPSKSTLPTITSNVTKQIPTEPQPQRIPINFTSESQRIPVQSLLQASHSQNSSTTFVAAQNSTSVSADIKSKREKSPFPIETMSTRTNLIHVKFDRKGGLVRKPRDALFNRWTPELKDLLVTSSLDGNIQLWNAKERRIERQITKDKLSPRWIECLCWATPRTLLGSATFTNTDEHEPQLFLVNVNEEYDYSVIKIPEVKHPKGISAIAPTLTAHNENPTSNFSFLSAGLEKQIYWWSIRDGQTKVYPLHSKHTATVNALMYTPVNSLVYSGGADSKVVGWDVVKHACTSEIKFDGRVNCLTENPKDPHLYLVTTSMRSQQLRLHDQRINLRQVLSFGWEQEENLSKYIAPSFHSNGYLVACGSESAVNPYIRLWDLRYIKVGSEHQNILCHEKKVLRTVFHPTENYMVSLSVDRDTAFIDFNIQ